MFAVSCKRTVLAEWKPRMKLLSILRVFTRLSFSSAMFYMESLSRNYLILASATTGYSSPAFFHRQDLLNTNHIIRSPGKGYYPQDLSLSLKFSLLVALTEHIISVAFQFAVILHIKRQIPWNPATQLKFAINTCALDFHLLREKTLLCGRTQSS